MTHDDIPCLRTGVGGVDALTPGSSLDGVCIEPRAQGDALWTEK